MDDMIFIAESKSMKLILDYKLYQQMVKQCRESLPLETGGILVGCYTDDLNCAKITKAIEPTKNSRRGPFSFFRNNAGLADILNDEWEHGFYYLGEWHFHPNSSPVPSGTDIRQMIKISKHEKLHCPEPILLIIGGNDAGWSISAHVIKEKLRPFIPINASTK